MIKIASYCNRAIIDGAISLSLCKLVKFSCTCWLTIKVHTFSNVLKIGLNINEKAKANHIMYIYETHMRVTSVF